MRRWSIEIVMVRIGGEETEEGGLRQSYESEGGEEGRRRFEDEDAVKCRNFNYLALWIVR